MDALLHITTLHYLVFGAALFLLGVIGVLTRRNVVIVLMSIALILNAVNLNLVALSRYWQGIHGSTALHGQVFAIFVITDAAAEAAVGLGILVVAALAIPPALSDHSVHLACHRHGPPDLRHTGWHFRTAARRRRLPPRSTLQHLATVRDRRRHADPYLFHRLHGA